MFEIDNLNVWFPSRGRESAHVVQDLSLSVEPGMCLGLVGESGCGKTSTALAALGLLPPGSATSGEIRIEGRNVLGLGDRTMRAYRWTKIALVPQAAMNSLNPVRRIGRQIEEVMRVRTSVSRSAAKMRCAELLERVGLRPTTSRLYPHELSGGMKQRVVIALALSCSPKVLIADEATTALDVVVQRQVLKLLRDITNQEQMAMLMISHDLAALSSVCDELAVMYLGRIVDQAPAVQLIRNPGHPHTESLVRSAPALRSRPRPPEDASDARQVSPLLGQGAVTQSDRGNRRTITVHRLPPDGR